MCVGVLQASWCWHLPRPRFLRCTTSGCTWRWCCWELRTALCCCRSCSRWQAHRLCQRCRVHLASGAELAGADWRALLTGGLLRSCGVPPVITALPSIMGSSFVCVSHSGTFNHKIYLVLAKEGRNGVCALHCIQALWIKSIDGAAYI